MICILLTIHTKNLYQVLNYIHVHFPNPEKLSKVVFPIITNFYLL
eukprot:UN21531